MANYSECKNCGNTDAGTTLYQCKKCGGIWCEDCSTGNSDCQHCGEDLGFWGGSVKILGKIRD